MHSDYEESGASCREEECAPGYGYGPHYGPRFGPPRGVRRGLRHHVMRHGRRARMWELLPTREEQIALLESAKAEMERDLAEIVNRIADLKGESRE